MSEQVPIGHGRGIVIEMPLKNNDLSKLIETLPNGSYSVVIPKNFDGAEIIQIFLEVAKITIPALITYLVATRTRHTITIKYSDNKVSAELQTTLSNRMLRKNQLYERLEQMFTTIAEKANGGVENGIDN